MQQRQAKLLHDHRYHTENEKGNRVKAWRTMQERKKVCTAADRAESECVAGRLPPRRQGEAVQHPRQNISKRALSISSHTPTV